jgi:hypothetical protein
VKVKVKLVCKTCKRHPVCDRSQSKDLHCCENPPQSAGAQ